MSAKLFRQLPLDPFSPSLAFSVVYLAYFSAGVVLDLDRAALVDATRFPTMVVASGLAAFLIGTQLGGRVYRRLKPQPRTWAIPWAAVSWTLVVIGLIASVALLTTGQIGLLSEATRVGADPKLTTLALIGGVVALYLILRSTQNRQRPATFYWLAVVGVLVASAIVGYRSPLALIAVVAVVQWHYTIKKLPILRIAIAAGVVVLAFSLVSVVREYSEETRPIETAERGTSSSIAGGGAPDQSNEVGQDAVEIDAVELTARVARHPGWLRSATATFVAGRVALTRIVMYVDENGTLGGELHRSAFLTVLPGEQVSPRTTVTDVVNAGLVDGLPITRYGLSTTPTLLGQLYLDGGPLLALLGMLAAGVGLGAWHAHAIARALPVVFHSYALVLGIALIGIHTGILDPGIFMIALIALLMAVAPGIPARAPRPHRGDDSRHHRAETPSPA